KMEEAKGSLAIEIEHAQVIGFTQVGHDGMEMSAVPPLGHRQGHLVGDEFVDALGLELSKQGRVGERSVRGQDHQRAATRKQQGSLHDASSRAGGLRDRWSRKTKMVPREGAFNGATPEAHEGCRPPPSPQQSCGSNAWTRTPSGTLEGRSVSVLAASSVSRARSRAPPSA